MKGSALRQKAMEKKSCGIERLAKHRGGSGRHPPGVALLADAVKHLDVE